MSYEEEGTPAKVGMKRVDEEGTGKTGETPLKYHVKLIVAEYPTTDKAAIFKIIDNVHTNILGSKNFHQQDRRRALKGGPTTLISMAAEHIYSILRKREETFKNITAPIYQADILTLLDAIFDAKELEMLCRRIEKTPPSITRT